MPSFTQPSFARGEVGPELYGRFDTSQYQVALKEAYNVIVQAYGGADNRPGTQYIGPIKNQATGAYFIPFKYTDNDSYILEFGETYMRVIRNDAHVLEAAVTITGITKASPAVVTTSGAHGYSNGDDVYITTVEGMTEVNSRFYRVAGATATTFQLTDQVDGANVVSTGYTAYSASGTVEKLYEIETPYSLAEMPLVKFAQSADYMTLAHPSYRVRKLVRSDHDSWAISEDTFEPLIDHPTGITVTVNSSGAVAYRYVVTALDRSTLEESLTGFNNTTETVTGATQASPVVVTVTGHPYVDGDEVELNDIVGMTELNGRRFTVTNAATNTIELYQDGAAVDGAAYTAYSSGGSCARTFVAITNGAATADNTISWTAVAAAGRYSIYKQDNGVYGWIGDSDTTSFTDDNIAPDLTVSPPRYRNPFFSSGDYPAAVGFHEQRRVMGGSNDNPNLSEFSVAGDINNYAFSTPSQADDAFGARLVSDEVNQIRHYVPGDDLIVLTAGDEWRVYAADESGFQATSIKQKSQTSWGAAHPKPLKVNGTILFVQENEAVIRSIGYDLSADAFVGKDDLTLFVPHIFRTKTIERWAFSRNPSPTAFVVRSDGLMPCMTFNEEQSVLAWSLLETDGEFEEVATIRPSALYPDEFPYFVVKRVLNGRTVRYIERLHSRRFTDVRDCFFVDCGLSYDTPITVTGISSANPVVITAPSHGLSNGDEVDFSDIKWTPTIDAFQNQTQPDQLISRYTVASKTTNTFEIQENAVDVDGTAFSAYLSGGYVRKAVNTVSGLFHLAGATVQALADGNVFEDLVVSSTGTLTLPDSVKASRIHVGLRYSSSVETLDFEVGRGATQGQLKMVPNITVRLARSRGLLVGTNEAKLTEMKQREFENYGEPTALLTGDRKINLNTSWGRNVRMTVRQIYPLPMSLLFVKFDYDAEDG